ncbi:MAG: hypothetical protein JW874_07280 [Spirochaetales bacterium]|nr:hypothetical protein [Spirochaetales bacterium]
MKKVFLIALLTLVVSGVFADEEPMRLYFTLSPVLGQYFYWPYFNGEKSGEYTGSLNLLSANLEFKLVSFLNLLVFAEFTGHWYDGHEDSDSLLMNIWGLIHLKAGAGPCYGVNWGNFRFSAAAGVFCMLYTEGLDEIYPGIGIKGQFNAAYYFSKKFFLGLSVNINDSYHFGDDVRLPFEILEIGAGLTGGFTL